MLKLIKRLLALAFLASAMHITATPSPTNSVLILYDGAAPFGWIGDLHSKMLANLMGHFNLNYTIKPVENYQADDVNHVRATFYFGTTYGNPLPSAFTNDVVTTTNTICWFRYNFWQVSGNVFFPQPLDARIGFRFLQLDSSGYTNITYKGVAFQKNAADPELGLVGVLDTNIATVVSTAYLTNGDGSVSNTPYIIHGDNWWYVADVPFTYMNEEDRFMIFADVLHDILDIDHAESHQAVIRIEDVSTEIYAPADVTAVADYLHSTNVPFAMAFVPVYNDPLGFYNSGVPEEHFISDTNDADSVAFLNSIHYAISNGAQLIIHGYTHQYDTTNNPYDGVTGDDFEFWREGFEGNTNLANITIYEPIPEDSPSWVQARIDGAFAEMNAAHLPWVGWEFPHYSASILDYSMFATNFSLTMQRALYFADDYTPDNDHVSGQLFPYVIQRDIYGQKIMPENLGNVEPVPWNDFPARLPSDIVRAAQKNLVVRDGWANSYFHGFYDITNLHQVVEGIRALNYTFVPLVPSGPPVITFPPRSQTNTPGTTVKFGVAAIGSDPLSYQWRFNGNALTNGGKVNNATTPLLKLVNVQLSDEGNYSAVITNIFGVITSTVATLTLHSPPIITAQPQSQTNILGTSTSFSVTAIGSPVLTYQWLLAGAVISSGTNSALPLSGVQTNDAGDYSVIVANDYGSVTSSVATLTVGVPPSVTGDPASSTNVVGTAASFSVSASGDAPLAYQWRFNGSALGGATNATLSLASVQTNNAGNYSAVINNNYGSVTSAVATLTAVFTPTIVTQPANTTNLDGTDATFTVTAAGTGPLGYEWFDNGSLIAGLNTNVLVIPSVKAVGSPTNYFVIVTNAYGSVTSSVAVLTIVLPPSITNNPLGATVLVGGSATFTVGAAGTSTLNYQWRLNGGNVSGANAASLALTNIQAIAAGGYDVVVTNNYGAVTSTVATLIVNSMPVITNQPASTAVVQGTNATFAVSAIGTAPLAYQWYFNATNQITSETNASVTVSNAQTVNAGGYTVVITNAYGAVTSSIATLTVHLLPSITNQPVGQTILATSNVTFTVGVTGDAPFAYQWLFNGTNISAATSLSYTLTGVSATNAGGYSVVVTNAYGAVTSTVAPLTVVSPPLITGQPASVTNVAGTDAAFSASVAGTAPLAYQWQFNGAALAGQTNAALTVPAVQTNNAGNYTLAITNAYGAVTSSVATLTVVFTPTIVTQPANTTNLDGTDATFTVTAAGTGPLGYEWFDNGSLIAGLNTNVLVIPSVKAVGSPTNYFVIVTNAYGSVTSSVAVLTIVLPPSITTPPASLTNIDGLDASFTVTAAGTAPLAYQWLFNGAGLAGATNAALTVTAAHTNNAGDYSVIVTNTYGSVTSSVATLSIVFTPAITVPPQSITNVAGTDAAFSVTTTGTGPFTYQWLFNGAGIGGATNVSLTVPAVQTNNAGDYAVIVNNSFGSTTSSVATLTVVFIPSITSQPASLTNIAGTDASFSVTAGGTAPLAYQWLFNGAGVAGGTNASLTVTGAQTNNAGNYSVIVNNSYGSVTSSVATLSIVFTPTVTAPQSLTNVAGTDATFSVVAGGTGPLGYQWFFNGTGIDGGTNASLTVPEVQTNNAGEYAVVVNNTYGSVTSSVATLTVVFTPVIVSQPSSITNVAGVTALFSVAATGTDPLTYQWLFNGQAISGATNTSLVLPPVGALSVGGYSAIVSNNYGAVTSSVATLTVVFPPSITTQPVSLTNSPGTTATFSVTAAGTAPLAYQWSFNNSDVAGGTNASLSVLNVQSNNTGSYAVRIVNNYGSVTSSVVTLSLVSTPTIITQPVSQHVAVGGTVPLTVVATGSQPLRYQWRRNYANVANATNATLTLANAQLTVAGNYTVVVSNNFGAVTSSIAQVTIGTGPVPTIVSQPVSQTKNVGASVTFSALGSSSQPLTYQWQFNGQDIIGASANTLTFASVQVANAGNYRVVLANAYGSVTSTVAVLTINGPAAITQQPQGQTNAAGSTATFTVVAVSGSPLRYQWNFNGAPLGGATNATLVLPNVQTNNAGNYSVSVANSFGTTNSVTVPLVVQATIPVITAEPPALIYATVGSTATITVGVAGQAPLLYGWWFNGRAIPEQSSATLTLTNVQVSQSGDYFLQLFNNYGFVTSTITTLIVGTSPVVTLQPGSVTNLAGTTAVFSVTASGTGPLSYQWRLNGSAIGGATNATLTLNNVQSGNAGSYTVAISNAFGSTVSAAAQLVVSTAPSISGQPQSQSVTVGSTVLLSVNAAGTGPLAYQWLFNGGQVTGATGSSLLLTNVQSGGGYSVVVTNSFGSVTSLVATVTVGIAPSVTVPPVSLTNLAGTTAVFSVTASGTAPLTYQWRLNGSPVSGGTNATLTLNNVQTGNAGSYTVAISNAFGGTVSAAAQLVVTTPPSISGQPQGQSATVGNNVTLSVTAAGTGPLAYQWYFNGTNAVGVNSATLSLPNVQLNQAGGYSVVVTNVYGAVTSSVATLAVSQPINGVKPVITAQPTSQLVRVGQNATFSVTASGTPTLLYQWQFAGVNVLNATNSTFTITNVQKTNGGFYRVVVSNNYGTATSGNTSLSVQ